MFRRSIDHDEPAMIAFALMLVTIATVMRQVTEDADWIGRLLNIGTMVGATTGLDIRRRLRATFLLTGMRMVKATAQHHVDEQQMSRQM